jgi:hypothetical protein
LGVHSAAIKIYNLNGGKIVPVRRDAQDEALNNSTLSRKFYRIQGLSLNDAKEKAKADPSKLIISSARKPIQQQCATFLN